MHASNTITFRIDTIYISGNYKTKDVIILRELEFSDGDSVMDYELPEKLTLSKSNLLKTSLFNFVTIDTVLTYTDELDIYIQVVERWYLWPELTINHADRNFSAWINSGDFSKLYYGIGLVKYNFRGRREKVYISLSDGYYRQFLAGYENICLDTRRKHFLNLNLLFGEFNRLPYKSEENKELMVDFSKRVVSKYRLQASYTFRNQLYVKHVLRTGMVYLSASDSMISLNEDYIGHGETLVTYIPLIYEYFFDNRDLKFYPLYGNYIHFMFLQEGLKFSRFTYPKIKIDAYHHGYLINGLYYQIGINTFYSIKNKLPYIIREGLGYNLYLDGLENYVIHGRAYVLSKQDVKFKLLANKILHIKSFPLVQFNKIHFSSYARGFINLGYVESYASEKSEGFQNRLLYTYGIGLDIITYYDKMLRLNLAWNQEDYWQFHIHFGILFAEN